MDILSRRQATLEHGLCLQTTLDGANLTVYVMLGDADLESIPAIVPPELVEAGAAIHAAGIDDIDQAQDQIDQVLENVSPGDIVVFFCTDENSFGAALDLLGLPIDD